MTRLITILILLVLIVGGGLWFLSTLDTEKPQTRVEKVVPGDKLGK
ncbi:hypothetical protein FHS96_001363 [Sphingomonas zeicaulis]